jgi:hypothetical protein
MSITYRLCADITGVQKGMRIVTVPVDAILELPAQDQHREEQRSGLVEALWEGQAIVVFENDLRTSALRQAD